HRLKWNSECGLYNFEQSPVGQYIVNIIKACGSTFKVERKANALVLGACLLFESLTNISVNHALLGPSERSGQGTVASKVECFHKLPISPIEQTVGKGVWAINAFN